MDRSQRTRRSPVYRRSPSPPMASSRRTAPGTMGPPPLPTQASRSRTPPGTMGPPPLPTQASRSRRRIRQTRLMVRPPLANPEHPAPTPLPTTSINHLHAVINFQLNLFPSEARTLCLQTLHGELRIQYLWLLEFLLQHLGEKANRAQSSETYLAKSDFFIGKVQGVLDDLKGKERTIRGIVQAWHLEVEGEGLGDVDPDDRPAGVDDEPAEEDVEMTDADSSTREAEPVAPAPAPVAAGMSSYPQSAQEAEERAIALRRLLNPPVSAMREEYTVEERQCSENLMELCRQRQR